MRNTIKNELKRCGVNTREELDALDPWEQIGKSIIFLGEEDRIEDSDTIEQDCWSYASDCHYTKTVGYWRSLSVKVRVRAIIHLDTLLEECESWKEEFRDPAAWERYCIMDALANISCEGDNPDWIVEYESDYEDLVPCGGKVESIKRLSGGYALVQARVKIETDDGEGGNYKSVEDIRNERLEAEADHILDMRKEPDDYQISQAQDAYDRRVYGD